MIAILIVILLNPDVSISSQLLSKNQRLIILAGWDRRAGENGYYSQITTSFTAFYKFISIVTFVVSYLKLSVTSEMYCFVWIVIYTVFNQPLNDHKLNVFLHSIPWKIHKLCGSMKWPMDIRIYFLK